jgi:hypothetical protein
VFASDSDPPRNVSLLRELRAALEQLTRELMEWVGMLRHKALALRAVAARQMQTPISEEDATDSDRSLLPGSLDPRALAQALAESLPRLSSDSSLLAPLQYAGVGAEEAIKRARVLWDRVADPTDPKACLELADAADALAVQLEERIDEALDEYESLGDELAAALATTRPSAVDPNATGAATPTDRNDTPGRNA